MAADIDNLDQRDPALIQRLFSLGYGLIERYFRFEARGLDTLPQGPALYVGNHSSGLLTPDSFLLGGALYRAHGMEHLPYGLGHEVAISLPGVKSVLTRLGVVRASHHNAERLFARGDKALVYPGGDVDNMRPFRDRDRIIFGGRRGYIRLALRCGVPIVPVVTAGAHEMLIILDDLRWLPPLLGLDKLLRTRVWPISLVIPWGLVALPPLLYIPAPVRVLMELLPPIQFDELGPDAANDETIVERCAREVEGQMQAALTRLAEERRERRRRTLRRFDPRRWARAGFDPPNPL
jgi:1-acyl-sn-glycerol-3-phosphate acyltransferase